MTATAYKTSDPGTLAKIDQSWTDLKDWDTAIRKLAEQFPEGVKPVFHTDPFEHLYCGFSLTWERWPEPDPEAIPAGWRYYRSEKRIRVNRALLRKKDADAIAANRQRREVWLPKTQPLKVILESGMAVSSSYQSEDGGTRWSRPLAYLVEPDAFYVQFDHAKIDQPIKLAPEGVWEQISMSEYWAVKEAKAG